MRCRKCRSEKLSKNGVVRNRQRYKCRSCGFNFTQEHANGWPSDSKMLIVMSYCLGDSISELAKQSGASHASVFRWIEEARESIKTGGEMVDWVLEALHASVEFALTVEKRPKTVSEIAPELFRQFEWWRERSGDSTFSANYEALGWANKSRLPTDVEFSELVAKRVGEIADILRKSDFKPLSGAS